MLHAIILIAVFTTVRGDECVQQWITEERMVCVCNSSYCDDIDDAQISSQQYAQYTSSKSGKRFQLSIENFSTYSENNIVLTVDSKLKYQDIHGFGGAMTDSAALNIRTLSNETQSKLLESYYGSKGIRYTYARIPIAGTDFSTRAYTYDDIENDTKLNNFNLVEEDDYKINYLNGIKSIMPEPNSLRIFATPWSAPAWMKFSNDIKWGALKQEYYQLYADYIRKFFEAYKDRNIDIWGMTVGNEPLNGLIPFFPFNSMFWCPISEANWSTYYLNPTLSNAGFKPVYMTTDDQRYTLPYYPQIMFRNNETKQLFGGSAFHWYADEITSTNGLVKLHELYPDKFILMTEACTGANILGKDKVILGSWDRGEEYVEDIIQNLSNWVVGWIDWNLALDSEGKPNWAKNYVDAPIIVNAMEDEFYKNPMFYALGHFSKFVPRGSRRIFSSVLNINNIGTIAFLTPEQKVVIVINNTADKPYNITIKHKNRNNVINLYLEGKSFTTILYQL